MIPINIPTLNDSALDFDVLFVLWQRINQIEKPNVGFSFHNCNFLQQNAVAFIGALIRFVQYKGGEAKLDLNSFEERVRVNLEQNGFLNALGFSGPAWDGNSIPYREDVSHHDEFTDYLSERWLGKGWIQITQTLKQHITQSVIEAYINVFDHANSPIGVITCGQRYPQKQDLKLAMVDFGVGIPATVRKHLKKPDLPASEAIKWAFTLGKTTKEDSGDIARGVGLKLLKSFIKDNGGKLEIYSDKGYACISSSQEIFRERTIGFEGTLVQITLKSETGYYNLPVSTDYDSSDTWF